MEEINWSGTYVIETKDENGNLKTDVIHNMIQNIALDMIISVLRGVSPPLQIKYIAFGDSNAAVTAWDYHLGNETFRTPFTAQNVTGNCGEILTEFTVLAAEAVGTIEEIGIFGGDATDTKDSGTLISRILWHKVKTNAEELTIKRLDKLGRG